MTRAEAAKARRDATTRKALAAMQGYFTEYKALPSYGELVERMGLGARSWAHTSVARLIELGRVRKLPNGRLAPTDQFFDVL